MNRRLVVAIGTAVLMAAVSACGSGTAGAPKAPADYTGQTLTVWLMQGDAPATWQAAVTEQFQAAYPGAKLNVQQQSWDGIRMYLSWALSGLRPPDVVDIGNTQTSYYVSTGGLLDLGPYRAQLGGTDWSSTMNASTLVGGHQYAAPWFAGLRVVMYNKALWAKARLTPPSTQSQWISDLRVLQNTSGVSSALWLPGQDWYDFDGFLQQAGASIIVRKGNQWVGNLDSPAGFAAATLFQQLQSFGQAPKNADEAHPTEADVFAKGDVASMIALGYEATTVLQGDARLLGVDFVWRYDSSSAYGKKDFAFQAESLPRVPYLEVLAEGRVQSTGTRLKWTRGTETHNFVSSTMRPAAVLAIFAVTSTCE